MIKVITNESFAGYYEIYDGLIPVEEIQGRAKARRLALKMARKAGQTCISFLGKMITVE